LPITGDDMAPALAPAALFGLLIGSFLNVVAWRLPRGESLVKPRSKCPGCDTQLKAYDNIPLFSWLVLRGRCRNCKTSISARYPVVEAVTAALYALVVAVEIDHTAKLVLGLVLVTFLVPIAVIDLDVRRIPNALTAPAAVLAIVLGALLAPHDLPEQLAAGVVGVAVITSSGGMTAGRKTRIPFGPFLAVGALVAYFAGDHLVDAYLHRG
jgi:leader peptidase (prepilin peptidase)/N-methyltransferase